MPEVPLQYDLFTGSLVDRRTRTQKEQDKLRQQPSQLLMFSQRDIAHTDVNPHPRMNVSPGPLVLIREDPRTDEEREADTLREAQSLTASFLSPEPVVKVAEEVPPIGKSESPTPAPVSKDEPRQQALLNLEAVITDVVQTVYAEPEVIYAQTIWLAQATIEAQSAGVDTDVISASLKRITNKPIHSPKSAPVSSVPEAQPNQHPSMHYFLLSPVGSHLAHQPINLY